MEAAEGVLGLDLDWDLIVRSSEEDFCPLIYLLIRLPSPAYLKADLTVSSLVGRVAVAYLLTAEAHSVALALALVQGQGEFGFRR